MRRSTAEHAEIAENTLGSFSAGSAVSAVNLYFFTRSSGGPGRSTAAILARFRVFAGFVSGALVWWWSTPTLASVWMGATIAAAGEAIRLWAAGHLDKSREVTSSGPYRWVAHPLYLGSSVMGIGLAVASWSMAASALIGAYLVIALTAAARREEAFLQRTFGDRYERYRDGAVDTTRRFSWARVGANHEYRALIGLLLAVGLLALKVVP